MPLETDEIAEHPTIGPEAVAADWYARLSDDPDARLESEFSRWRDASPAHRAAYERVAAKQGDLRAFSLAPEILALRHQTLVRLAVKQRTDGKRRAAIAVSLAAGLVTLPIGVRYIDTQTAAPTEIAQADAAMGQIVQTAKGQRSTLTLADGSRVTLNTATRVRIAYNDRERRLALEDGQAWFEVAKNRSRPFVVQAGSEQIVAHGTAFDVRRLPDRTEVMLAEGRVTVKSSRVAHGSASVTMNPNELVVASGSGIKSQQLAASAAWSNWRKGIVAFDNTPLTKAVAEMNRYSETQLVLADAATGRIAISGTFNAGENKAFVEALNIGFKVHSSTAGQGKVLLRAAR